MAKDIYSKKAIGVLNDDVKMVHMGSVVVSNDGNEHLLTFGLGPCVGVAVVIKEVDEKVTRLLAHIDMGQMRGVSFDEFNNELQRLKRSIVGKVQDINISLVSTESYTNMDYLNDRETMLLAIVLKNVDEYNIKLNDINFERRSQVQISPNGTISTYTEEEIKKHRNNDREEDLTSFGGYVDAVLNIYITKYGAFMCNSSLGHDSSEEEIKAYVDKYYQRSLDAGYEIVFAPSFEDPECLAAYVKNWEDPAIRQNGHLVGCLKASRETGSSLIDTSSSRTFK